MADLKLIVVEPYTVGDTEKTEFKHHYEIDGILFKAGDQFDWRKYVTKESSVQRMERLLTILADFYHAGEDGKSEADRLRAELEEVHVAIGEIEKENQRKKSELTMKLREDAQDLRVYFQFVGMEADMLELDSRRKLLMAQLSKPAVLLTAATKLIQSEMRCLLPLIGSEDGKFFVWHAPQDHARLKPDMLRDYPMMLEQLLGKDEFLRLIETRRALMQPGNSSKVKISRG